MKVSFRKNLQITSVRSNSDWNKMEAFSLLQDSKIQKPVVNAYISNKFVKSKNKLIKIALETSESKRSIQDQTDLSITNSNICIDNLPAYTTLKGKYLSDSNILIPQRTSQVSKGLEFVKLPKEFCTNTAVKRMYEKIMLKQIQDYRDFKIPTENFLKRYLRINEENKEQKKILKEKRDEMLENFLPMGVNSRLSASLNPDGYIKLLEKLISSRYIVENELGEVLITLLKNSEDKYPTDISSLIDEIYPKDESIKQTQSVLDYLSDEISKKQDRDFPTNELDNLKIEYLQDSTEELVTHYEYLMNPLGSEKEFNFTNEIQMDMGNLLFDSDENVSLSNIGRMDSIKIHGMMSVSLLSKFLNMPGIKFFIPLFEESLDLEQELERKESRCIFVPQYLNMKEGRGLKRKYEKKFSETYSMIKKWRKEAKECLSQEIIDEYTRYLLPNAHATSYFMYTDVRGFHDLINSKLLSDDVNIDEKIFVYELLRLISIDDLIWKPLLRKHIKPDITSKFN